MCHFLIFTVAAQQADELRRRLVCYKLRPVEDLGWLRRIHPDRQAFWISDGHCGCGLYDEQRGLSLNLVQALDSLTGFGLWIQWGDRLPPLLRSSQVAQFCQLVDFVPEVAAGVYYSVELKFQTGSDA